MQKCLHTGASPGHSYTVKSPTSFSSSDVAPDSETLGSALCLFKIKIIIVTSLTDIK